MNAAPPPPLALPSRQASPVTARDARFWDRAARKYAADPIADEAGYERSIARCRALLGAEARVLELGCGTGSTALKLAPHVAHLTGTDLSAEMVAIAEEKRAAAGLTNLRFVAAEAADPSLPAGSFDAVLAMNLLHLVPDMAATLAVAHGLLRPGGLLITKTPCLSDMNPLIRLVLPLMRWVGKAPASVRCFTDQELLAALQAAGFTLVAVERHGTQGRDTRPFIVAQRTQMAPK